MIRRPPRSTPFPYTTLSRSTQNAVLNPRVSASGVNEPPLRLVATVDRTATPRAPPICCDVLKRPDARPASCCVTPARSEEHTSELQSRPHLVCRLLLEKKTH